MGKRYTIMSTTIRVSAAILSGILLSNITPVSNWPNNFCPCVAVWCGYGIACFIASDLGSHNNCMPVGYFITNIISGLVLAIVALATGHIACSFFLLLCAIISTTMERLLHFNDN